MQKCDSNNFCKRNRGTVSSYSVDPKSLKVHGAELSAVITNTAAKQSFNFTLRAYGPVIRLIVDELSSDSVPRYQVPDILEPSLDKQLTAWESPQATAKTWTGKVGDVTVQVTFANFKVEVLVGKTPVLVFNSRSMFNMEHPRKKQVRVACLSAPAGGRDVPSFQGGGRMLQQSLHTAAGAFCKGNNVSTCTQVVAVLVQTWMLRGVVSHAAMQQANMLVVTLFHAGVVCCDVLCCGAPAGWRSRGLVGRNLQRSHRQQAIRP